MGGGGLRHLAEGLDRGVVPELLPVPAIVRAHVGRRAHPGQAAGVGVAGEDVRAAGDIGQKLVGPGPGAGRVAMLVDHLLVVVRVHEEGQPHLLQVARALDLAGLGTGLLQCGQQHGRQDRDDGDHHKQFDERECTASDRFLHTLPSLFFGWEMGISERGSTAELRTRLPQGTKAGCGSCGCPRLYFRAKWPLPGFGGRGALWRAVDFAPFPACIPRSARYFLERCRTARWCNGSTTGSGPVSLGSSPGRAAISFSGRGWTLGPASGE